MSFGSQFALFDASPFPTTTLASFYSHVAAPFWSDADARLNGTVWYEVHDAEANNANSNELLDQVSAFIRTEEGVDFAGNLMIVATWDHVHPWPHGEDPEQDLIDGYLQSVIGCPLNKCLKFKTIHPIAPV